MDGNGRPVDGEEASMMAQVVSIVNGFGQSSMVGGVCLLVGVIGGYGLIGLQGLLLVTSLIGDGGELGLTRWSSFFFVFSFV